MSIGNRIKELRKILNLTAVELSEQLNIPVRTIGSYERNEAQPGPKFFIALLDKFSVNINWVLSGYGEIFIASNTEKEFNCSGKVLDKIKLSPEELNGLSDILNSDASRDMVFKLIEIKKGSREALDSLIYNLQGIKAVYG